MSAERVTIGLSVNASDPALDVVEAPGDKPYVGLRPYSHLDKDLFFGRDDDAQRLRNKIYAGPLTILYAPSGVGKTSLLQALVVPALRQDGTVAVCLDPWAEEDPLGAIKRALIRQALQDSVQVEVRPDWPLGAIVEGITRASEKNVVIILDQFEQFLIRFARQPDPLREELAELVRSDLAAHVVLSLRQEFLAALDIFSERVLNLFRSTYHLMRLDGDGAREAIAGPAARFKAKVEDDLENALLKDLRSDPESTNDPSIMQSEGIELPFLQIVCERLWKEDARGPAPTLTWDTYDRLGRTVGIVKEHVATVVNSFQSETPEDMPRVLEYLAPRSGTKMTYAVQDLAALSALTEERVIAVLKCLELSRVVRPRRVGGKQCFELYHDAFIRILREWVDRELVRIRDREAEADRAKRKRRLTKRAGASAAGLLLLVFVGFRIGHEWQTNWRPTRIARMLNSPTKFQGDTARKMESARSEFLDIASRLIESNRESDLAQLRRLLHDNRRLVETVFADEELEAIGVRQTGRRQLDTSTETRGNLNPSAVTGRFPKSQNQSPEQQGRARGTPPGSIWNIRADDEILARRREGIPLVLAHDADWAFNTGTLQAEWQRIARHITDSVGVVVHGALGVIQRSVAPATVSVASLSSDTMIVDTVPLLIRDSVLVSEATLPTHVRWFFFHNPDSVIGRQLDARLPGGRIWLTPRWTLPIWRAGGHRDVSRERYLALMLAARLLHRPELLLTQDGTDYLLERESLERPAVVGELLADAAGPRRVRQFLTELVQRGRPITAMGYLLEVLASSAGESPQSVVTRVIKEPSRFHITRLQRPASRSTARPARARNRDAFRRTYEIAAGYEHEEPDPLRIFVAASLGGDFLELEGEGIRLAVMDSLARMRHEQIVRFGVASPVPSIQVDTALQAGWYRIELLAEWQGDSASKPRPVAGVYPVATVLGDLRVRLAENMTGWVTAEDHGRP
ncbi:MAG: hypothetical protein ACRENU_05130, partial [Gemmatimonadaceae bacterium]